MIHARTVTDQLTSEQPRIVTLAELRRVLLPHCLGWAWAEDAIADLWKLGAPVPVPAGQPERRILIPRHFARWWGEVQQRTGGGVDAAGAYDHAKRQFRTHS